MKEKEIKIEEEIKADASIPTKVVLPIADDSGVAESSSDVPTTAVPAAQAKGPATGAQQGQGYGQRGGQRGRGRQGDNRGGRNSRNQREPKAKPEYDQKLISIRRVARVSSGGRRFNFSVAMVLGNRKGMVGVGTGKGADTAIAIDKATRNARKNVMKVNMTKQNSIPHDVTAKYSSAIVSVKPAKGRGLVAGSSVRNVLELAGLSDVTAKVFSGSKNQLNNAMAAIKALKMLNGVRIKMDKAERIDKTEKMAQTKKA